MQQMSVPPDKNHMTKAEISELPMRQYEGPIVLCRTTEEAEAAADRLKNEPLLGFDTETRPAFRKGESYDPSLLQLAAADTVYLFQIKQCGFPPALLRILSAPEIKKAGVAIDRDVSELKAMTSFEPAGFVELATYAKAAGIRNLGLRGLTAILFGFRISKKEQVSNWARKELTESQQIYAATDAWLGRQIYLQFETAGLLLQPHAE